MLNTSRTTNFIKQFAAVVAMAAMLATLAPMQAMAAGSGAVWTNLGPCGSPQNVNEYEVGQNFYGHGSNFASSTAYTWVVKEPGSGGAVFETGTVTTDENGDFCESLFEITENLVGGPYQFVVGDAKNDNFKVNTPAPILGCTDEFATNFNQAATEDDGLCTYELTISKVVAGVNEPDYTAFSFMIDGGEATPFEQDGTNVVTVSSTTHSVVESEAVGYSTTYSNCSSVVFTEGSAICTITNTPAGEVKYGSLMVEKVVVGVETPDYTAFSFMIDGGSAAAFEQDGTNELQLAVGTYTITETPVAGYTTTYTNCEGVQVSENAITTCTITNTVVTEQPRVCAIGDNLLANGSFEEPVVGGQWSIFSTVAGWMISLSDGLELWRNFMGGASNGAQNAELDGNSATRVSQSVTTVPGATYALRFDFSPRPNTTLADNVAEASVDGAALLTVTGDGSALTSTQWTTHGATFVASATSTTIGFEDKGTDRVSYGTLIDNAVLCFVSAPVPQCLPELDGSWADEVTTFDQGTRKDSSPVLAARSDEADALGTADWTPGEGVDFLSLGFGGSIVLTFGPFIPDVLGNDITVHEATNGTYPAETALVEVSQDGITWFTLGTATNPGASSFDFSGTGLSWVKYVRLTDTSNPTIHSNDADGFDLDAVFVSQTVCDEPADPTPKTCSIVSDETTLVDGASSTLTWVHPRWTTELTSGEWIWDATVEPTNGETVTFTKTFFVDNVPTGATLKVAVDNRYTATLNGNPLSCDGTGENNFTTVDTCAAPVVAGLNTLTFVVTNDPYATTDAHTNPSGLIYELTIDGATCSAVPTTPEVDTYKIEGFVWHDDNENELWDSEMGESEEIISEDSLAGWEVRITNGSTTQSTTTDEFGYYYFEVEAGTWVITEVLQSGWALTTAESHTVTVPIITTARPAFLEWLIPTAHAAVVATYGPYDFGNNEVAVVTTNGGGGGGGGSSSGSRPRSRVLGSATPMPLVLGEQVSAVPYGAPAAGHGGTSSTANTLSLFQILFVSRKTELTK